jgi:tetratricopeptide (TPR) repeat protein
VAACAECHKEQHESYLLTTHSRALGDVDPAAEPPDGAFDHAPSGRSYRAYRAGGQLRHEEVLRTAEGREVARVDLPVRYLVGSGNYSRTYLAEVDGFLHESPITWYTARSKWATSPGYDAPDPPGFERAVGVGCLFCHAGRAEESGGAVHRLTLREKAIGCENCHGPGSLHQQHHRAGKHVPGEEDLTIVHPDKLPRSLQEDICAVCHLSDAAIVHLRGRQVNDFRPGRPLSDYRVHYKVVGGDDRMTVVGHTEQLRLSACYQKSKDLTCLTCHDQHQRARPADPVAYYRQKCLNCHTAQACSLDQAQRLKKDPADNCAACHMPRGDTEIPHIAFTHHRIGRHAAQAAPPSERIPLPVPTDDVSRLAPIDRQRNLGLAYLQASKKPVFARHAEEFRQRVRANLEAVREAGLRDGESLVALADVYWKKDASRTRAYAREALEVKDLPADVRALALMLLADCEFQDRNLESAVNLLVELVLLRRYADDWRLLGSIYLEQKQPGKALPALQQALAIRPDRAATHSALAEAYRQVGDQQRANEHLEKARWLSLPHKD